MRKIEELIALLTRVNSQYPDLVLPSFQREFVWGVNAQKSLIASVLTGVPCTSSLIVETNSSIAEFKCRKIGGNIQQAYISLPANVPIKYLLDGQQRYSTLFHVFHNIYHLERSKLSENKEILESIFEKLGYRWFLSFKHAKDFLGFENMHFDSNLFEKYLPEDLLDLEVILEKKLNVNDTEGFSINSDLSKIKSWCLENNAIPLFIFFDSNNSYLIKEILSEIQRRRFEISILNKEYDSLRSICLREITDKEFDKQVKVLQKTKPKKKEKEDALNIIETSINKECAKWAEQIFTFLNRKIGNYELNPIVLTDVSKAVSTYTFINTGGTKLTAFDLICSRASFDLRKKIQSELLLDFKFLSSSFQSKVVKFPSSNFGMFDSKKGWDTSFAMFVIHVFNLLHFRETGTKIEQLPSNFPKFDYSLKHLSSKFIADNIEEVIDVIRKTAYMLYAHCGHSRFSKTTNKLALLPIAAALLWSKKHDAKLIKKIRSFYWIKLFAGYYDNHQNEQSHKDTMEIVSWLAKRQIKIKASLIQILDEEVMKKKGFSDIEVTTTESKMNSNSSLKNNLMFYLRSIGEFHDFDDKNSIMPINTIHEIHHIIPLATASSIGKGTKIIRAERHMLNALMNLTPISKMANGEIGKFTLSQYSTRLKTITKDNHHLTDKWIDFTFDENNSTVVKEYKDLLIARHENISKDLRTRLRKDLG